MLSLILLAVFAIFVSYFALQNTVPVTVTLANAPIGGVPLYIALFASFLVGLFLSFVLSLFSSVSTFFALRGRDNSIHKAERTISDLSAKVRRLETENAELKGALSRSPKLDRDVRVADDHKFGFADRLRERFLSS